VIMGDMTEPAPPDDGHADTIDPDVDVIDPDEFPDADAPQGG
jgi:hypothetical protein